VQVQAELPQPMPDRLADVFRLAFGGAMDDGVVAVPLEPDHRELSTQPGVESEVHEQIRQQRRDRGTLRGAFVPPNKRAIGLLYRRGPPPLHIQQHPWQLGVALPGGHDGLVRHVVEESLDIQIDDPGLLPSPLLAHLHRIQRRPTRAITVRIGMKHLLHLRVH
jgi:hypothetical protein